MGTIEKVSFLLTVYSQNELAKKLGCSQVNIHKIHSGKRKGVKYDLGLRIDSLYKKETSKAAAS